MESLGSKVLGNSKHEVFAQAVADGLERYKAYMKAYPGAKASYAKTAYKNLTARPEVMDRIAFLQEKNAETQIWKREDSLRVLASIANGAEKDQDRINAVRALNEMHGWDQPKTERLSIENNGIIFLGMDGGNTMSQEALDTAKRELQNNLISENIKPVEQPKVIEEVKSKNASA